MKKLIASVLSVSMVLSAIAPSFAESKRYVDQSTRDILVGSTATAAFLATTVAAPITGGLVGTAAVAPAVVIPAVPAVAATAAIPAVAPAIIAPSVVAEALAAGVTSLPAGATILVGDAYAAAATHLAIGEAVSTTAVQAALPILHDTLVEAFSLEVGNTAPHFLVQTAGVPGVAGTPGVAGSPAVYSAGSAGTPGVTAYRPDSLFGIQTATLIQGAAIGLFVGGVLIPWITGTNINPSGVDVLTCEGFKVPSGKQYRYVSRAVFAQCLPEVAKASTAKSIGLSPNTPAAPKLDYQRPTSIAPVGPAPIKRLPKKG
jgi:hypothetical protein